MNYFDIPEQYHFKVERYGDDYHVPPSHYHNLRSRQFHLIAGTLSSQELKSYCEAITRAPDQLLYNRLPNFNNPVVLDKLVAAAIESVYHPRHGRKVELLSYKLYIKFMEEFSLVNTPVHALHLTRWASAIVDYLPNMNNLGMVGPEAVVTQLFPAMAYDQDVLREGLSKFNPLYEAYMGHLSYSENFENWDADNKRKILKFKALYGIKEFQ